MANRYYDTAEQLQMAIDMWQLDMEANKKVLTVSGLALALGFCDRKSLYDYEAREAFGHLIKQARLLVEESTLQRAVKSNGAGSIFYLKNLGYTDKQIVEVEPISITITGIDAKL